MLAPAKKDTRQKTRCGFAQVGEMNGKSEKRLRKVVDAVKTGVAEAQAQVMQDFLKNTSAWPLRWRLKLAFGVIFRRYK